MAGLAPAISQAQKDLQAALAGPSNLPALQKQMSSLLAAVKGLRADLEKGADSDAEISLQNPAPGVGIRQSFGQNPAAYKSFGLAGHEGIDYACALGTPIRAAADGVVFRSGATSGEYGPDKNQGPYGIRVTVEHTRGSQKGYTVYAHLSSVSVQVGDRVQAGDEVGKSGNTGHSTGAHLHFEVRPGGPDRCRAARSTWQAIAARARSTVFASRRGWTSAAARCRRCATAPPVGLSRIGDAGNI